MSQLLADRMRWGVLPGLLLIAVVSGPVLGQCRYTISLVRAPECPFTGPPPIKPLDINAAGHFVGRYQEGCDGDFEAYQWTPERGVVTLPRPAGFAEAEAHGLNDRGQIVGLAELDSISEARAILWDDGEPVELGILPESNNSAAYAINNAGQIVGGSWDTIHGTPWRAILWEGDEMIPLDLPRGPWAIAVDINESGVITGWMGQSPREDGRVFIWRDGVVEELPRPFGATGAEPIAINNRGHIVGLWHRPEKEGERPGYGAFLWDGSRMRDLGTLPQPFDRIRAESLNDVGQVVGSAGENFFWQSGHMHAVQDLVHERGARLRPACVVSDHGRIVCGGADAAGDNVAIVLQPLPRHGDTNIDCRVDTDDVLNVLRSWGPCDGCHADLTQDGLVDLDDLSLVLTNWG